MTNTKVYRWFFLVAISLPYSIAMFHRVGISTIASNLLLEFNISYVLLGLLGSAYFYSYAFFQPLAGLLSDRGGPIKVILACTLLLTVGALGFAFSPFISIAIIFRIIIGLSAGGTFVPVIYFVSQNFESHQRAKAVSLIMILGNLGALAAAGPLSLVLKIFNWREATALIALITFVLALVILIFFLRSRPRSSQTVVTPTPAGPGAFRFILKNKSLCYSLVAIGVYYGALMSFQGLWGVPFLMDVYQFSKSSAAMIIMLMPIGLVSGSLVLAQPLDTRFGRSIWIAGLTLTCIIFLLLGCSLSAPVSLFLYVSIFLLGFCNAVVPYLFRVYSEILPPAIAGKILGLLNVFPFIGVIVFQPLTGMIFDIYEAGASHTNVSYRIYFLFLAAAMVLSILAGIRVKLQKTGAVS